MGRIFINALVGFVVGIAGGLIGLGGAELRLPYLIGYLRLSPHTAVRVNLAVSLVTIVAALPTRLATLPSADLPSHLPEVTALAIGAIVAAYVGAGALHRLSADTLAKIIAGLLLVLGIGLLIEAAAGSESTGFHPDNTLIRIIAALAFGVGIGLISSLLGVAGGEVIIPTLVFGYGIPIKAAGSLSLIVSLPTVVTGLALHLISGSLFDGAMLQGLILPIGIGAALGAIIGGLMIGIAPAGALKVGLGVLLIWSAWKVGTTPHPPPVAPRT